MRAFELLMNCIGKRVFHLLFFVSTLLMCKACAQYFYYAEENIKCPICEILKSIRNPARVSVSNVECLNYYIVKPAISETTYEKQLDKSFRLAANEKYRFLLFEIRQFQKHNGSFATERVKLYLLFSQLKIGNGC